LLTGIETAREAERAVLGAAMLSENAVDVLASEHRLKPEHFSSRTYRLIWEAMLELREAEGGIDSLTVATALKGKMDRSTIAELEASVPIPGHWRDYARTVIEEADWRRYEVAVHDLGKAISARDRDKRATAERLLSAPDVGVETITFGPDRLADEFWDFISNKPETFTFPFRHLNTLTNGGMRRGGVTLIGGWTSDGKSAILDQMLEWVARIGTPVHLFINEMTRVERVARTVARMTGIPLTMLSRGQLTGDQRVRLTRAL
jgi:replicative DNA helicase